MKRLIIVLCLVSSISLLFFGCQQKQTDDEPTINNTVTENPDSEEKNTEENTELPPIPITEGTTEKETETQKNKRVTDVYAEDILYNEDGIVITYNGITYEKFLKTTEEVMSITVENQDKEKKWVEMYTGKTTYIWEAYPESKMQTTVKTAELNLSKITMSISQSTEQTVGVGRGAYKKIFTANIVNQDPSVKVICENDDLRVEQIDIKKSADGAAVFVRVVPKDKDIYVRISDVTLEDQPFVSDSISIIDTDPLSDEITTLIATKDKICTMLIPFRGDVKDGELVSGMLKFTVNYAFEENGEEKQVEATSFVNKIITD